jgi:hypothetical protein
MIEDDSRIELFGSKTGNVSISRCPKIGWKNMWYGKKRIIDYLAQNMLDPNEIIINCRFDIFLNSNSLPEMFVFHFIERNKNKKLIRNLFPFFRERTGIDNIYMGTLHTMFNLIYHFHYNLDDITQRHVVGCQEFLVFRENLICS